MQPEEHLKLYSSKYVQAIFVAIISLSVVKSCCEEDENEIF